MAIFSRKRILEIKNNPNALPNDAFSVFCDIYGKFVEQSQLRQDVNLPMYLHSSSSNIEEYSSESNDENEVEKEHVKKVFRTNLNPTNLDSIKLVFTVFQNGQLATVFPTIYTALKICLTLPVFSASTERSFSKLKIIKSRLRTTMSQSRLEDLMIISCENDLVEELKVDYDKIIDEFAAESIILTKYLI